MATVTGRVTRYATAKAQRVLAKFTLPVVLKLQDTRHRAGYDVHAPLTFTGAERSVMDARRVVAGWQPVRGTDNAQAFLAALVLSKHWNRDEPATANGRHITPRRLSPGR